MILSKLFFHSTKATRDLKEAYKNPGIVPALCECLVGSDSPQVCVCRQCNRIRVL